MKPLLQLTALLSLFSIVFAQDMPDSTTNNDNKEVETTLAEPEPLMVSTRDDRYQLMLNSSFINKIYDGKNFISARFVNAVPNDDLTLLRQSPDTIVFGFSIPKPKERQIPMRDLIDLITKRLENIESVTKVEFNSDNLHLGRITYLVENSVDEIISTELCALQMTFNSVDTICANSELNPDGLNAIIESIELK